tara:strand:- start:1187 stop:1411 length:225 start_codon:yes stop_codon:yes gene_type:complete
MPTQRTIGVEKVERATIAANLVIFPGIADKNGKKPVLVLYASKEEIRYCKRGRHQTRRCGGGPQYTQDQECKNG